MSKKILVVENDADISRNLKELFEDDGFEVSVSTNGMEALMKLRSGEKLPDLIMLDLMMPVMDGFIFKTNQGKDPLLKHIPVVVMTADGHVETKKIKIGAAAFIRKPLELGTVLGVVNKHIL